MQFVEEVVVDEFLPTFRSMLAEDLRERGLTQKEVASLLGISQSAVSKYAHGDVERNERLLGDERVQSLVTDLGEGLASGDVSPVQALAEAEVLIRQLERGDLLAQLHEEAFPALAAYEGPFDIHDPDSNLRESERVLASVRRGLRTLENASGFASLIPAVGSNLVECLPDATDIEDVAGVPGRILDVKGRATIPADPEFGVSEYAASILLEARRAGSDARAALNVRYDPATVDRLEAAGHTVVRFEVPAEGTVSERASDAETAGDAIRQAIESTPDADVLYQTGGFGIEPIIYVLAPDAPSAAETVRELL